MYPLILFEEALYMIFFSTGIEKLPERMQKVHTLLNVARKMDMTFWMNQYNIPYTRRSVNMRQWHSALLDVGVR